MKRPGEHQAGEGDEVQARQDGGEALVGEGEGRTWSRTSACLPTTHTRRLWLPFNLPHPASGACLGLPSLSSWLLGS
jgi:hypothetical protein